MKLIFSLIASHSFFKNLITIKIDFHNNPLPGSSRLALRNKKRFEK
jgi:hypothetical protein